MMSLRRRISAKWRAALAALFALALVVGGLQGGVFSPSNASAVAASVSHHGADPHQIDRSGDLARAHAQHDCCDPAPANQTCAEICAMPGCGPALASLSAGDASPRPSPAAWPGLSARVFGEGPEAATPPPKHPA